MPKKASTTPAPKQRKTTPTSVAETDTKWEKLSGVKKSPQPTKTRSKTTSTKHVATYSSDADKFPHYGFPYRLEYMDGKDKKICWFQCEDHFIKHVTRYHLNPKDYKATTNLP